MPSSRLLPVVSSLCAVLVATAAQDTGGDDPNEIKFLRELVENAMKRMDLLDKNYIALVEDTENRTAELEKRITESTADLKRLVSRVDREAKEREAQIQMRVDVVKGDLDQLDKRVDTEVASLDSQIDAVNTSLNQLTLVTELSVEVIEFQLIIMYQNIASLNRTIQKDESGVEQFEQSEKVLANKTAQKIEENKKEAAAALTYIDIFQERKDFVKSSVYEGKNYYISKRSMHFSLDGARQACLNIGGDFPLIENFDMFEFIYTFVSRSAPRKKVFTGITDQRKEGDWIVYGRNVSAPYLPFYTGLPDGGRQENCLVLCRQYRNMNDRNCGEFGRFLCEAPEKLS